MIPFFDKTRITPNLTSELVVDSCVVMCKVRTGVGMSKLENMLMAMDQEGAMKIWNKIPF